MAPCMHAVAQRILAASVVLERRACAQSHFGVRRIAVAREKSVLPLLSALAAGGGECCWRGGPDPDAAPPTLSTGIRRPIERGCPASAGK
eukprot:12091308-Alexandrium_andersonii.AAC.1